MITFFQNKKCYILTLLLVLAHALHTNAQCLSYDTGARTYVVPVGVTALRITAKGADGAFNPAIVGLTGQGGSGAVLVGTFAVLPNDIVKMYVGSKGSYDGNNGVGSGGGGTGVILTRGGTNYLLLVAGAGGGSGRASSSVKNGVGGRAATNIVAGGGQSVVLGGTGGGGYGFNGMGWTNVGSSVSGGGAASLTSISVGGVGSGVYAPPVTIAGGNGFGGGGAGRQATGGGGGGYAGGDGGTTTTAGGGGGSSYINTAAPFLGTLQAFADGVSAGSVGLDGKVSIQTLSSGYFTTSWVGAYDADAANGLNWCGYVPDSTINAAVLAGTAIYPVFAVPAKYRSLTNNPNASFTLNSNLSVITGFTNGGKLNGTGTVTGNLTNTSGAVVTPGTATAIGKLSITGKYVDSIPGQGVKLNIKVAGTTGAGNAAGHDALAVTGNATINSLDTVNVSLLGTFKFSNAQTFTIITAGSVTGSFGVLVMPAGYTGSLVYTATTVTLTITGSVLPLQLTGFAATAQKNTILLNWQTTNETGTSHFVVQRSSNGAEFTSINNVAASGNASATKKYEFTDDLSNFNTHLPTVYYRLQNVDKDGSFTYSNVVSAALNGNTKAEVKIYPNPIVGNSFTIEAGQGTDKPTAYTIYNTMGLLVQQGTISQRQQTIGIGNLAKGAYLLRLSNGQAVSLVKQ